MQKNDGSVEERPFRAAQKARNQCGLQPWWSFLRAKRFEILSKVCPSHSRLTPPNSVENPCGTDTPVRRLKGPPLPWKSGPSGPRKGVCPAGL